METQTAYRNALRHLLRSLARHGVTDVRQVRKSHLDDWAVFVKTKAWPRSEGRRPPSLSPRTIAHQIGTARAFFRWVVDQGLVLDDPARGLTTRGLVTDPVSDRWIPSESEMREFLDRLPAGSLIQVRDAVILELVYSSGLRVGEVERLDLYDLDLESRTVKVRQGKGRKDRVVPLGRRAKEALLLWLEDMRPQLTRDRSEPAVFLSLRGHRLGRWAIAGRLRRLRRRAGLTRLTVHGLRHACALHLIRRGADVRSVQELLGHARLTTTQVYTALAPEDLKREHRRCHPREKRRGSG